MPVPHAIAALGSFWHTTACLFLIVLARYFIVAGAFYWFLYGTGRWRHRKLKPSAPEPRVVRNEMLWSVFTSLLFAAAGSALMHAWKHGHTLLYADVREYGALWFVASLPCLMLLHETYFYWTHRWMHHPRVFRHMHYVHHESYNPTPWAAFSFHPLEGLVQAAAVPLFVCLVPTHVGILLAFLIVMTVLGVINHCGFEIYPRGLERTFVGRHLITASNHFLHHHRGRGNFGLYFTFWDRWCGTFTADTDELYRETTERRPETSERLAA